MPRVLTIEDDAVTGQEIVAELTSHGLEVDWADNGREGLAKAIAGGYDLITLDRMLPEVDGLTIVTTLRNLKIATPILMISALSDVDERVRGLRAAWRRLPDQAVRLRRNGRASRGIAAP